MVAPMLLMRPITPEIRPLTPLIIAEGMLARELITVEMKPERVVAMPLTALMMPEIRPLTPLIIAEGMFARVLKIFDTVDDMLETTLLTEERALDIELMTEDTVSIAPLICDHSQSIS